MDFERGPQPRPGRPPLLRTLEPHLVLGIANEVLPQFGFTSFSESTGGNFNTCYIVSTDKGQRVVLRLAPASDSVIYRHEIQLLRREATLLDLLPSQWYSVPKVLYRDFTNSTMQRDIVIHTYLTGKLWSNSSKLSLLKHEVRLWEEILSIADYLKDNRAPKFGFPPPAKGFTRWSEAVRDLFEGLLSDLSRHNLLFDKAASLCEIVDEAAPALAEITVPRLVHGDLWPKNVLLSNVRIPHITGILDWERSYWGDPLSSWILINSSMGGRVPRTGYIYRCSLTSADYMQIPSAAVKQLFSPHTTYNLRNCIYYACYLLLRRLEQQRYLRHEQWIFSEFDAVIGRIRSIL